MIYIEKNDIKIPTLGFGTWQMTGENCITAVSKALEVGYRHIDTAQIYGNEEEVGEAIKNSGVDRGDIFLTTKVWTSAFKMDALQKSIDNSLKNLKTDYIDLILLHWPNETEAPFNEQMAALKEVQESGKTKLIGVSNFTVAQTKEIVEIIGADIVTNQVEYHPFLSQEHLLNFLRSKNMFLTAYCPLAQGSVINDDSIKKIAEKYNKNSGQVVLRWLIQQDSVVAIPKASNHEHIVSNFNIFDFELSESEIYTISTLARNDGRIINPGFAPEWD